MPVTDAELRSARPRDREYKLFDGRGLHLVVKPNGSKVFRVAYRFQGRAKQITLSPEYPRLGLAGARRETDRIKAMIREGRDPVAARRQDREQTITESEQTLSWLFEEWFAARKDGWSPDYADDVRRSLELHVLPTLGGRSIHDLMPADLLAVLRPLQANGARRETVKRICQRLDGMYRLAVNRRLLVLNPAAYITEEFPAPIKRPMPHLRESEVPAFFAAVERETAKPRVGPLVELGLWLIALTVLRSGALRGAEWSEIDREAGVWTIPAARMKGDLAHKATGKDHVIPLTAHILVVLDQLARITGHRRYLLPGRSDGFMSENGFFKFIERIGYKGRMTAHGFRHVFSTSANEHDQPYDVIEMALGHVDPNKVRGTYNRAEYIRQRRELLTWWGERLDALTDGRMHRVVPEVERQRRWPEPTAPSLDDDVIPLG